MRTLEQWLLLYSESHQNPTNKLVHKICVPIINFTVVGLLWVIPTPEVIPYFNWSFLVAFTALVFYFLLSPMIALIMFFKLAIMMGICFVLQDKINLLQASVILFILAWIGQFWGHKVEGKKPSFFQDIQFLLIGPLWVIKAISGYPKLSTE